MSSGSTFVAELRLRRHCQGAPSLFDWFPQWPFTDEGRFCDCVSSTLDLDAAAVDLGNTPHLLALQLLDVREEATIVQSPSTSNGFLTVLEMNDNSSSGAAWYDVVAVFRPGDVDFYEVDVGSGVQIQLSTSTPGDGVGEFANALDPQIRVYSASGAIIAEDILSGNAQLDYTSPGRHFIGVFAGGAEGGEYILQLDATPIAGVTVSPTAGLVTSEGGGTDEFTVVLNTPPASDVTITLSSSDTTEGNASPSTLIFSASDWNVPQTVTVTGENDAVLDGDIEYAIVTEDASSIDPNYSGVVVDDVSVTNQDDEVPTVATKVVVAEVTYSTTGGKAGDRHLRATVRLEDDLGNPVADATVSIELRLDSMVALTESGATVTDGTVTFRLKNAPSGMYQTVVTSVSSGLTWNEITPENSFDKP